MSQPTVVNATAGNGASATQATMTAPGSLAIGNKLIAVLTTAAIGSALVQPAGWTLMVAGTGAGAAMEHIIDGNEPANWTWTWTTTSTFAWVVFQVHGTLVDAAGYPNYGCDVAGVGGPPTYQANASSGSITAPTITPRWNADLLVNVYCDDAANAITVPASQTGQTFGNSTGNSKSIIGGWENLSSNAATGTRVATATAAVNRAYSFVFREPVTGARELMINQVGADVLRYHAAEVSGLGIGGICFDPCQLGPSLTRDYASPNPTARQPGTARWVGVTARDLINSASSQGFSGYYKVRGYCKNAADATPLRRQVFICPELSPVLCLAHTFSDEATGYYEFLDLAAGNYIVQGHDQSQAQNDVVWALVPAVPM